MAAPSNVLVSVAKLYKNTKSWKATYRRATSAACSRNNPQSLCSSGSSSDISQLAQLVFATSPSAFSSLDPSRTGGVPRINAPGDQRPCNTCAGFAVAAAAEAAVASVLQVSAT